MKNCDRKKKSKTVKSRKVEYNENTVMNNNMLCCMVHLTMAAVHSHCICIHFIDFPKDFKTLYQFFLSCPFSRLGIIIPNLGVLQLLVSFLSWVVLFPIPFTVRLFENKSLSILIMTRVIITLIIAFE